MDTLQLIKYIVERFADKTDDIEYKVEEKETSVEVTVLLDPSDMGKVIGKQGRIAKAIRSVVKAAASKEEKKVTVDIVQ